MKRIVLALVVLMLTAPAMADVVVEATQVGDTNEVTITYLVTGEPNHVRAFALDISVTDGNIIDIKDFFVGECTSDSNGYGIFMGSIDLTDANIPVWNNPVAPITHPNAAGEIPGPAITVELGSLYKGAPNAPADSGLLFTIVVSDCTATVNLVEEGRRGGIMMEDGNPPTGTVYLYPDTLECPALPCMKASHPAYNRWLGGANMANEIPPMPPAPWSEPDCWCYPRHCSGDADGAPIAPGVAMWVSLADLSLLRSAVGKMYTDPAWPAGGECSDFDKAMIAPGVAMPVSLADLSILRTYVGLMDLPPGTVPCCDNDANCVLEPSDDFNFWTASPYTP